MLLAIDIGNTNIKLGFFKQKNLSGEIRIPTQKNISENILKKTLSSKLSNETKENVTAVIIGSVVPELDKIMTSAITELFSVKPLLVKVNIKTNIDDFSCKTNELGADRLCDVVAAIEKYSGNRIIIDLGTATKFEIVSAKNEYLGGAIGPGVGSSFQALLANASKIPDLKLSEPKKVIADWSTQEHLNSGFIYGFASLVDGMTERIVEEEKWTAYNLIITGGYAETVSRHIKHKHVIDKHLILDGLRIIWELNRD